MSEHVEIIEPHSIVLYPTRLAVEDFPRVLEVAGRTCYKSEDKITLESNKKFVEKIRDSGHHSVLEHCSITVKIVGDRSMSHQLVRHRIAAFSQESMRYCDYSRDKFGGKLQVICPPKIQQEGANRVDKFVRWSRCVEECYRAYLDLREMGVPAEDARSVLPQSTKTEVVTTFNVRQWRHVFEHRALNPKAQWQIRRLLCGVLLSLAEAAPILFGDLREKMDELAGTEAFPCTWA
jgi:thymidylate synthase (FAD)